MLEIAFVQLVLHNVKFELQFEKFVLHYVKLLFKLDALD